MKSIVFVCFLVAGCFAEEMAPSQAESTFFNMFATNVPAILAQQQIQRRMADIFLGLTISSSFQQMAMLETMKYQSPTTPFVLFEENAEPAAADEDEEDVPFPAPVTRDAEEEDLEEYENQEVDEDDVSLLEMKEDFLPFMGGGMPGQGQKPTRKMLEHMSAAAKTSAVKAMMIQFFLAGGDVEKSYLANRMIMATLPPQMTTVKLFKTYLTTITLASAFQFQDAFNTEQLLDDLNDHVPGTAVNAENRAELQLYTQWTQLVTLKFALFMFNLYEKMSVGQFPTNAANNNNAASSYLELNVEATPFVGAQNPATAMTMYTYMSYYIMILKYYALYSEYGIAQAGLSTSMMKLSPQKNRKMLKDMEFRALPAAFGQWASTNQMRYYLEYYLLMWEMQIPALGLAQVYDRADNVFQNLVQTDAPVTETTTAAPVTETTATPAVAAAEPVKAN